MQLKKKTIIVWSIIAFVAAVAALLFWLDGRHTTWRKIEKSATLRVVTDYNEMNYFLDEGEPSGFNFELIRLFIDSTNLALDLTIESDYEKRIAGLRNGSFDVMISQVPITEETRRKLTLSDPILKSNVVLVQRGRKYVADSVYVSDMESLEGRTLFIEAGSPYILWLENIKEDYGVGFAIEELSNVNAEMLCGMVVRGEADYVVIDGLSAQAECSYHTILDYSLPLSLDIMLGWAVAPVPQLQERVNGFIAVQRDNGTIAALRKKYVTIK